jgi:hypothetical protein
LNYFLINILYSTKPTTIITTTTPKMMKRTLNENVRKPMKRPDATVMIDCGKISERFEKITLKTTRQAIEKTEQKILEDTFTKPEIFPALLQLYKRNIFAPSGKYMFKQFQEGSEDYKNWGSDVILYYIVRKVLYNESIPF